MLPYALLVLALALMLAYTFALTRSTLMLGRRISETNSTRGLQDAVTPPWSTNLALVIYLAVLVALAVGFWRFGWIAAVLAAVTTWVVAGISTGILLRIGRVHFERIIITSMTRRYADFRKSNDVVRAEAMAELLDRVGIPVEDLNS